MAYATANPKQTRESHFKHFFGAIDRLLSVSMRLCICHVFVRPIWMHATLMFDLLACFQLNSANILRCEKWSKKKNTAQIALHTMNSMQLANVLQVYFISKSHSAFKLIGRISIEIYFQKSNGPFFYEL